MKKEKSIIKQETNNIFWLFLLQGMCLVGMGILVAYQPMILVALVASGFIAFGIIAIVTGFKVKSFGNKLEKALPVDIRVEEIA